ncbi:MAG TPA: proline--tRNA ligase [Candidatus Nanoarchaeia archaeon]|nr:proline--tRNA ligase [Candidatus Nanoarchaeia archaeon]
MAKDNQEGLSVKKSVDFSGWYQQLILKSELADYSSVSGCIIFRPLSYGIWEKIKELCDEEFKKISIKNCYFPLFIPEKAFAKEKEHVKGFAPEVAWVTQAGNTKLNERLAIRPTSEAIMYESYSKWIRSHRDLPLQLNQWNNVVRWEFNNPVPFFRTREFLWNEGHSAFATEKEALDEGIKIKEAYETVVEEFMALPGIYGKKTEKEKFAGAVFSEKLHYMLPNGKVIEGPCFHHNGQNFAKAYQIKFLDKNGKEDYVWQNTYAISTRMLGTMFAIHSDDKGLILPPKLVENKIVIIPILFNKTKEKILKESDKIGKELSEFNPILDSREEISPGWKYNEWELKGIPLRIEIGPRDLEKKSVIVVKRTNSKKQVIKIKDLKKQIPILLEEIQIELFKNAKNLLDSSQKKTEDKKELIKYIKEKNMVMIPLCNSEKCEDILKTDTNGAKTLFISPDNPSIKNKKCIICNKPAKYWVYVGKTY